MGQKEKRIYNKILNEVYSMLPGLFKKDYHERTAEDEEIISYLTREVKKYGHEREYSVKSNGESYPHIETEYILPKTLYLTYNNKPCEVTSMGIYDSQFCIGCEYYNKQANQFISPNEEQIDFFNTEFKKQLKDAYIKMLDDIKYEKEQKEIRRQERLNKEMVKPQQALMKDLVTILSERPLSKIKIDQIIKDNQWKECKEMSDKHSDNIETFYYCGKKGTKYNIIQITYKAGVTEKSKPLSIIGLYMGSIRYK